MQIRYPSSNVPVDTSLAHRRTMGRSTFEEASDEHTECRLQMAGRASDSAGRRPGSGVLRHRQPGSSHQRTSHAHPKWHRGPYGDLKADGHGRHAGAGYSYGPAANSH